MSDGNGTLDRIRIEQAGFEDAGAILALQKLAYRSEAAIYRDFTIAPLRQTLAEMHQDVERQVVLKATLGERIVGSARAYEHDGSCHIGRVIVDPEFQNRGLGARLMGAIEERFRGARRYELFTGHRSERNLRFYRKLGYRPFRTEAADGRVSIVYLEKTAGQPAAVEPESP